MAGLGRTISALSNFRRSWDAALAAGEKPARGGAKRLREVKDFGANPGNLRMLKYVPGTLAARPGLVVVLHGCEQTAASYDHGAGWSTLADRHGFALLFPEQKRVNNRRNCFNWFERGDTQRDLGEAMSIRRMVERMVLDHDIDRSHIFVTGLSAGGAMTSVMLATYPEVFAGGAIIAGLPYGAAANVQEALDSMFKGRRWPSRHWGDLVRAASSHEGPWPKISVWHGSADATVVPMNADEIVKQWVDVHRLPSTPTERAAGRGFSRAVWRDRHGREVIESVTIPGMAHGAPLATGEGDERGGQAGPFLLEVGVSSTHRVAEFFGLLEARVRRGAKAVERSAASAAPSAADEDIALTPRPEDILMPGESDEAGDTRDDPRASRLPIDVQQVITNALKAAGLMRS